MSTVTMHVGDTYTVLELNRPKANAINLDLVHDLHQAITKLATSDSVKGVILTAKGSIFCAGLDVVELYDYSESEMDTFWVDFTRLLRDLIAFPKPLIAAINGHSPAGGCVFSLCCDHRIMAHGDHTIGLNEVPVSIVVPEVIVELARFTLGDRKASQMLYNGLLLHPEQAREFGLVDETCPGNELMIWAETKMKKWVDMPEDPWRAAKKSIRKPLVNRVAAMNQEENVGGTLRAWWDGDNRAKVGKLVEKLRAR
ncbi:MAG: enoyl-CoA hydratase [Candidatus Hydrogenedentota bacterium]|nr:MAG: enoyl-CoA hydratase [Candidatus Hydrogenedentota bacterium]